MAATPVRPQFSDFLHATNREDHSVLNNITKSPSLSYEDTAGVSPPPPPAVPVPLHASGVQSTDLDLGSRSPVAHHRIPVDSMPLCISGACETTAKKIIADYKLESACSGDQEGDQRRRGGVDSDSDRSEMDRSGSTSPSSSGCEKTYTEAEVMELMRRQHAMLIQENDEHMQTVSGSSMKYFIKMTPLSDIFPHEEVLPERVEQFHDFILSYGINNPICIPAIIVDINTNVIIDGHHRYYTLKKLGLQQVEMLFIDYMHEDILVESKANIGKDSIVEAGRSGKLVRPKLTRHLVLQNGKYVPLLCISAIISFVLKIAIHQI